MTNPHTRMIIAITVSLIVIFLNIIVVSSGEAEEIYESIDLAVTVYRQEMQATMLSAFCAVICCWLKGIEMSDNNGITLHAGMVMSCSIASE